MCDFIRYNICTFRGIIDLGVLESFQTRGSQFWTQSKTEMENLPEPDMHVWIYSQTSLD